jgi:predicted nucleotidyltransferase
MVLDDKVIAEIVKRVVAAAKPTRVILFGSFARGDADEGSDIDLLVIMEEVKSRIDAAVTVRRALDGVSYPFDIVVTTERDFERYRRVPGVLYDEAATEGVTLYAS